MALDRDFSIRAWSMKDIVANYAGRSYVLPAEVAVLGEIWADVRGGAVLDIGIGAGRTIPYVRPLAGSYVAIDVSPEMVAACRQRFPGVDVRQGDARDLADFKDASLDLVVFSFNGIDYVHPDERPRVLAAVFRVLRPGGYFYFSSHNRRALDGDGTGDGAGIGGFKLPSIDLTLRPLRMAVRLGRAAGTTVRRWRNHQRLAGSQIVRDDIAFVNDGAHDGALLTCYVDPAAQVAALGAAGFRAPVKILGADGTQATDNPRDAWLHYLARR
jgi:SAM-dependent methyltransferase